MNHIDESKGGGDHVNIEGREISQRAIEGYLRACRYNQSVGNEAADEMQRAAHRELLQASGIKAHTDECIKFSRVINRLVDDLLRGGH